MSKFEENNSVNEDDIKKVLTSLFNFNPNIDESNIFYGLTKDPHFLKELEKRSSVHNIKDFSFLYNYDSSLFTKEMFCKVLDIEPSNHNLLFLLTNYSFIEGHFKKLIAQKEGSACSADKSGFIMSSLIRYYKDNKDITINYEQQYTYHLPKVIFNNQEKILEFFDGVQRLYYGQVDKFIMAYSNVLKDGEVKNTNVENKQKM